MSQIPNEIEDNRSVTASDLEANYQALETKFAKILFAQNEQHQTQMKQMEEAFGGKMEQLKDEFSKMLADHQKQMMAQFEILAQNNPLEQKLKEAEQRGQIEKEEEIIHTTQRKMEILRKEKDENGKQATGSNQMKLDLDYMWQLLSKGKILANPMGNVWNKLKTNAVISKCGLKVASDAYDQYVFALEGHAIAVEHFRKDYIQFRGTILFYYEVTLSPYEYSSAGFTSAGFTDGRIPDGIVGDSPNSYGIAVYTKRCSFWLSEKEHELVCPSGAIKKGAVVGCGIMLNSTNELAVFFTLNGILIGNQTPINPTVDRLYPTIYFYNPGASVEANFGDNLVTKPFKFEIDKCPGLV